jgi:hypothetical protein
MKIELLGRTLYIEADREVIEKYVSAQRFSSTSYYIGLFIM